jgi:hypothetical protein
MNYVTFILLLEDAILKDIVLLHLIHLWEERDGIFWLNLVHNFTKHQSSALFILNLSFINVESNIWKKNYYDFHELANFYIFYSNDIIKIGK